MSELPVVELQVGDCLELLRELPDDHFGAVVCDPPYALSFMGRDWDKFTPADFQAWCESWARECYRVLRPGGHLVAFGGSRTFHRLFCGVEDAGFDIRDVLMWMYGTGWPKSHDASKIVDAFTLYGQSNSKAIKRVNDEARQGPGRVRASTRNNGIMGSDRGGRIIRDEPITDNGKLWRGYGSALKPAFEPIVLARKPFTGTLPANLLEYGVGALNLAGARVVDIDGEEHWPTNVLLDEEAGVLLGEQNESATRLFYCAKPSVKEKRAGVSNKHRHDTVKPLALMRYLVRLVASPDHTVPVLDPFAGSGTTGLACLYEQYPALLMEQDAEHAQLAQERLDHHRQLLVAGATD